MVLNEEQQLLKDTIAGFLDEHAPTSALRELRDNPDAPAWQDTLWQQLCEMGFDGAQAQRALAANNGDLQQAVAALTSGR